MVLLVDALKCLDALEVDDLVPKNDAYGSGVSVNLVINRLYNQVVHAIGTADFTTIRYI